MRPVAKDETTSPTPMPKTVEEPVPIAADPPSAPVITPTPLGELFRTDAATATDETLQDIVNRHVQMILAKHPIAAEHNVLFLFTSRSITRSHADRIYSGVSGLDTAKPILLILNSTGGDVASAYFISKLCRQYTKTTFKIAIARQAKSAATLICCGADQIHMGSLSELGPIDPQFGAIPALALKYSIEHLAQLASQYPAAREMFSEYLAKSLNLQALGYYERVAESAKQYAERLLSSRREIHQTPSEMEAISQRLVYTYKDHGFVIDSAEAVDIFGPQVVQCDSPEYQLANALFPEIDLIEWILDNSFGRRMSFIGGSDGCSIYRKPATDS